MLHDDLGLHQIMFFSHLRQICSGQSRPGSRLATPGREGGGSVNEAQQRQQEIQMETTTAPTQRRYEDAAMQDSHGQRQQPPSLGDLLHSEPHFQPTDAEGEKDYRPSITFDDHHNGARDYVDLEEPFDLDALLAEARSW